MALNIALCDDIMGLIGEQVETIRETIRETAIAREKMKAVIGHLDDIHTMFSYHVEWSSPRLPGCVVRWAKSPVSRVYKRLLGDLVVHRWDTVRRDLHLSVADTEALCSRWAAGSPAGDIGPSLALAMRLQREVERPRNSWNEWRRRNGSVFPIS
jgi:hypothetical protein